LENKAGHGYYIESMDRQIISEEDIFLRIWLSREILKDKLKVK